jgi:hypothetical protein
MSGRVRRSFRVPLHRRWTADIIHFGRKTHTVGVDTVVNLAAASAARRATTPPVSWVSIWIKAVALAAVKWPELRTAYLPFPWPRLYVHPFSVVALPVEREWHNSYAVFFDTIKQPEPLSLRRYIDPWFNGLKEDPIEGYGAFRYIIRISKLPLPLRRMLWSIPAQWSGRLRSKYLGNFAINSLARTRLALLYVAAPASWVFYLGPVNADGTVRVQIFWDHRIADAVVVDRIMSDVESIINNEIVAELTAN